MKDLKDIILEKLRISSKLKTPQKFDKPIEFEGELRNNKSLQKKVEKIFLHTKIINTLRLKNFDGWFNCQWLLDKDLENPDAILYVDVDESKKEIILKNVEKIVVNITSGLDRWNLPYKILLPEGANLEIRDSMSSCRRIDTFKNSFKYMFSENNKFDNVKLVYFKLSADLGDALFDYIYANSVDFENCKEKRYMTVNSWKFKNTNMKVN